VRTDAFPGEDLPTVSSVLMHMIDEAACHTAHLDAARKLIDGRQWSQPKDS
jgi:hypothetical protein